MLCRRAARVAPRIAASPRPPSDAAALRGAARGRRALERMVKHVRVTRERVVYGRALAREAFIVDAGAATGPAPAAATEQRRGERRGRRGVADPHLAETDEIGLRRHGVVA